MPITKIGLNLTAIQNITGPVFDIKNNTEDFLNDIPAKANEVTEGYLGIIVLSGLFTFLFYKISYDLNYGGDFGHSTLRAMGISSAICSIMGLISLNLGYFTNYYHVVIFILIAFLSTGAVWKAEK